jgi:uncharacterized protein YdeI (YjbR/CyaY-like superfamily)
MKKVYAKNRKEWRAWLSENHDQKAEIWLVYFKKGTGKASIAYAESVEEALCYGWIDSIIKRIDGQRYARKFTPRKENSRWSASNIQRVEKMIAAGLMTSHGMKLVEAAKERGTWGKPQQKPVLQYKLQPEFAEALQNNPKALETFEQFAPTYQKQFIGWIEVAKRSDTKAKRIKESIQLLAEGKKLGLR